MKSSCYENNNVASCGMAKINSAILQYQSKAWKKRRRRAAAEEREKHPSAQNKTGMAAYKYENSENSVISKYVSK